MKRDTVKAATAADASRGGAGAMATPPGRLARFPTAEELTTADNDAAAYADKQLQLSTEFQARRSYVNGHKKKSTAKIFNALPHYKEFAHVRLH